MLVSISSVDVGLGMVVMCMLVMVSVDVLSVFILLNMFRFMLCVLVFNGVLVKVRYVVLLNSGEVEEFMKVVLLMLVSLNMEVLFSIM